MDKAVVIHKVDISVWRNRSIATGARITIFTDSGKCDVAALFKYPFSLLSDGHPAFKRRQELT